MFMLDGKFGEMTFRLAINLGEHKISANKMPPTISLIASCKISVVMTDNGKSETA